MIKKHRNILIGIGFAVVIALLSIFLNTGNFLNNLRTYDYRTDYISPEYFNKIMLQLSEDGNKYIDLKQLGYLRVNKDDKEKKYEYKLSDLYKLKSDVNYNFKLPQRNNILSNLNKIESSIYGNQIIEFNLNIDAINKLIKSYKNNNVFPENLKGKNFRIDFFKIVYIHMDNSNEYNFPGSINFSFEIRKIPKIDVPAGVDKNKVKYAVSSLPFLPYYLKSQIAGTIDLKNLLDIPESAKREKLDYTTINKNKGIIVSYYLKDANALNKDKEKSVKYLQIVWIEDDIIYQMEAAGISEEQLLKIAESMN
ncbi:DUF4367 domain-containing protein [Thermoanaerobacterium butyriciformans]|uniref:DUF4367 domain-containing protein n=1 Tax=Thermoanaerobacterium butyriciformans TaxID=1702242 RepID=A0ABS4NEE9_9THEO|nr:DUF4367 domain-containing protein [Thermoanaerobacterium butyriciformans]MBP2072031.1 hypothetical protein [Thermoanaerobacterium butyriciformans]